MPQDRFELLSTCVLAVDGSNPNFRLRSVGCAVDRTAAASAASHSSRSRSSTSLTGETCRADASSMPAAAISNVGRRHRIDCRSSPSYIADVDPRMIVRAIIRRIADPSLDPSFDDADPSGRQLVPSGPNTSSSTSGTTRPMRPGFRQDLACSSVGHQAESRIAVTANDILANINCRGLKERP